MRQTANLMEHPDSRFETGKDASKSMSKALSRAPAKRKVSPAEQVCTEGQPNISEELMELAVEAAQSLHLADFLERFAQRAARMLAAEWGGVVVHFGREPELHGTPVKAAGVTISRGE